MRAAVLVCGLLAGCFKTSLPGASFDGDLPPADEALLESAARIDAEIRALATDIGVRSCASTPDALARALDQVEGQLLATGLPVARQEVEADCETHNLVATLVGTRPELPPLVVGAHVDTARTTPGADDNASGVAALLELARATASDRPTRTVSYVVWTTEEPPFFARPGMGSHQHAQALGRAFAALSLETLGRYEATPHSQHYPFPLSLAYPSTGDFVAFVADRSSRELLDRVARTFREAEPFPSRGGAAPRWLRGIGWSDHRSYWAIGAPALMITDTALFRNPDYHRPTDTPDGVDPVAIARVTRGLVVVVRALAEDDTPP